MGDLGTFAEGFRSWRKVLVTVPTEARRPLFCNAAREIASYVERGLDKLAAVDELTDIAHAIGILDDDELQEILGEAFDGVEPAEVVPEIEEPSEYTNGKGWQEPVATAYVFPDPESIPPRSWLYAGHYVRGAVTATVAPGGYGKTTLTLYEMIAMALEGTRVWYISGEDAKVEIDRRIAAHCQHHAIEAERVGEFLWVDDKTSFALFLGRSPRTSSVTFDEQWLVRLEREIAAKRIDVVALDPFVSFHAVPENDNGGIDQIIKRLASLAQRRNMNFEISHHVRKPVLGQGELTVDDTRGGSSIVNAVRSCRVINRMSSDEAGLAKIATDKRSSYVRIDKGKRNMAPSESATWWHIVGVALPNGDNVQAIERWNYPSVFAEMSSEAVGWVHKLLAEGGPRRASSQSPDWLGHDLGRHCGRDDTGLKAGAMWANKIISVWLRNRVLKQVILRDERRKPVPFYAHPDFDPDNGTVVPFKRPD